MSIFRPILPVFPVNFLQLNGCQNDRVGVHDVVEYTHISDDFDPDLVLFLSKFIADVHIVLFLNELNFIQYIV